MLLLLLYCRVYWGCSSCRLLYSGFPAVVHVVCELAIFMGDDFPSGVEYFYIHGCCSASIEEVFVQAVPVYCCHVSDEHEFGTPGCYSFFFYVCLGLYSYLFIIYNIWNFPGDFFSFTYEHGVFSSCFNPPLYVLCRIGRACFKVKYGSRCIQVSFTINMNIEQLILISPGDSDSLSVGSGSISRFIKTWYSM